MAAAAAHGRVVLPPAATQAAVAPGVVTPVAAVVTAAAATTEASPVAAAAHVAAATSSARPLNLGRASWPSSPRPSSPATGGGGEGQVVGRGRRGDVAGGWRRRRDGRAAAAARRSAALVWQHLNSGGVPLEGHVGVETRLHQNAVLRFVGKREKRAICSGPNERRSERGGGGRSHRQETIGLGGLGRGSCGLRRRHLRQKRL